jgi:hypothetical protein
MAPLKYKILGSPLITMDDAPMFKMPTIDLSAKSLLTLSQLGFFAVFTYWSSKGAESNIDYFFPVLMAGSGLALFLSVPNSRMGVTLGVPALMVVMGLATGENEMIFWAVFMLLMFGPIAYMPALASGDSTLGLDDETRIKRLGIVWVVMALFLLVMMSANVEMAMDGKWTDEDFDGSRYDMSIDSTQQTIAQGALGLSIAGILVFLVTAVMGKELGPLRPWHGGAMAAGAMLIGQYLWLGADGGKAFDFVEIPFILTIVGLLALPPCIAYEGSSDSSESE